MILGPTCVNSTTDLYDLIRFIEELDRGPNWNGEKPEWERALRRSIPNWKMVVEKQENWDDMEEARPHKGHPRN